MAATIAPCPESTLTDRYQTTIPDSVRKALGLNKRDKICYNIQADGKVWISWADGAEENDPVLGKFLNFLAQDLEQNPQHPPDDWHDLLKEAKSAISRLREAAETEI
jgi:antitoxin PrlF